MKISIITVVYNNIEHIEKTILSVINQTYNNIEYIIVDGGSTDGTISIIQKYHNNINLFISEPDKGMYDAMNKGIKYATGDIIGLLNSDDVFSHPEVISEIADKFRNENIDALIGDIAFITGEENKIVRYYSSKNFNVNKFRYGYMPPHPSFYVKREKYNKYGFYKTDYKIAADYELLLRFLKVNKIKYKYVSNCMVKMKTGGISNQGFKSNILLNREILKACKENNIYTNYLFIYLKYFTKIFEFILLGKNKKEIQYNEN